jgi:hypothetical protein
MGPRAVTKIDWNEEMKILEARLAGHLTDEETAARLAAIDRLTAPLHRIHRERVWQSVLGLIGSGVIAVLTVLAFVAL